MANWVESKRHVWERNEDGLINFWALNNDENFHNGPCCAVCYDAFCVHCEKDEQQKLKEETCHSHPACSECGWDVAFKTKCCPNCGAKME